MAPLYKCGRDSNDNRKIWHIIPIYEQFSALKTLKHFESCIIDIGPPENKELILGERCTIKVEGQGKLYYFYLLYIDNIVYLTSKD